MDGAQINLIDLSAEALLELEELAAAPHAAAPAFAALIDAIQNPLPPPQLLGMGSISMLADIRCYEILRESASDGLAKGVAHSEFEALMKKYLTALKAGVDENKSNKIREAIRFCEKLNQRLLSQKTDEIYTRREQADARYVTRYALQ